MFAGYYRRPRDPDELLELVGLEEDADRRVRMLSGGQRRRLDLALALVGSPELLFLDEPTTGFDPEARRGAWETIRRLAEAGTTVLLTTHYLDEAATLADRVIVLRGGPDRRRGGARARSARSRARSSASVCPTASALPDLPGLALTRDRRGRRRHVGRADRGAARADGLGARAAGGARGPRGASPEPRGRLPRAHGRGRGDRVVTSGPRRRARSAWEQRLFWRNRQSAFFTFVLPVGLLAFGALGRHSSVDGMPYADFFVPGLLGTAIVVHDVRRAWRSRS